MTAVRPISSRSSSGWSVVSVQPLRHPINCDFPPRPGLQRTASRNVVNLEQMAENMSQGGSDIGEEIRRMNEEQKERSRQNSIQSSHQGDSNGIRGGAGGMFSGGQVDDMRSRASSNNIANVNGTARWGGYSPNGFVNSPVGSVQSAGGWSQASMPRKASASSSSRLAQTIEPVQEGRPLDSPLAPSGSMYSTSTSEHHPSRHASQSSSPANQDELTSRQLSDSSFGRQYDQIAGQIEESLEHVPPSPPKHGDHLTVDRHAQYDREGAVTPPNRPRSTDTYREAQIAFKDFDGVHFSHDTGEFVELDEGGNEVRRVSARNSSGVLSVEAASLLRTPRARPMSYAEPPPADGMVYYPAPVPRMLNMPKRLSQLPAASVQAKRRTQIMSQYGQEAMQSAPWIPPIDLGSDSGSRPRSHKSQESGSQHEHRREESGSQIGHRRNDSGPHPSPPRPYLNERMSVANMQSLPPQLRASVFFDHQSIRHDVQVKNESAVATLDSILAASATAPVSAFTDHPYAGDVRRSTFAPEHARARRSTATLAVDALAGPDATKIAAKRRSSFGNLLRRNSSSNQLAEQLEKRGSRSSLLLDFNEGGKKLQKRRSQMSLGDEVQKQADQARTPGNEISEPDMSSGIIQQAQDGSSRETEAEELRVQNASRPVSGMSWQNVDDAKQIDDDFKAEDEQEDVEESEAMFVQPSTLLAELQVRKAQQRSRNRTAATHFPNGMHSTLLQLDAVEQINKEKRKKARVPLAWEDPTMRKDDELEEDDDVPLGVLYPSKDGLVGGKKKMGDGRDWDRPLGLMEKREMEDSEPLASRRNRMLGLPPTFGRAERELSNAAVPTFNVSDVHLAGQPDAQMEEEGQEEEEGESLAQRLRKMKTKDALDTAISDVAPMNGERPNSTFTDDVLSQFGGLDAAQKNIGSRPGTKGKETAGPPAAEDATVAGAEQEEETLGQRRARLQREHDEEEEKPLGTLMRPGVLRASSSYANLLATNPVGTRKASKEHQPAHGTLLHASAQHQAKQRQHLQNTNIRSSSFYGLDKPLVDGRPHSSRAPATTGLLGAQNSLAPNGGFAGGMYNNGLGGLGLQKQPIQTSVSTPTMYGMGAQNSYFASPTAGMMGYGMQQPQQQMTGPKTYQPYGMPGQQQQMGVYGNPAMAAYGHNASQMQMPYGTVMGMMEEPLDNRKKESIDRWRMSVLQ